MRKYFLIFLSVILFFIFILLISFGLKIGPLKIYSYNDIINLTSEKNSLISELKSKNENDFIISSKNVEVALKLLNAKKNRYDTLKASGSISKELVENLSSYNIDEVWNLIKKFAVEKEVTVDMNLEKNQEFIIDDFKFESYNLKFVVSGDYINLTDFIYAIEDNDELGFEINDFNMSNKNGKLTANFSLNNILIKEN